MKGHQTGIACIAAAVLLWAGSAWALDADVKCESSKNKEAGKYSSCIQKAEAALVKKPTDTGKYAEKVAKCEEKFNSKWETIETKASGACPDAMPDPIQMENYIAGHSEAVAVALAGGGLAACADTWKFVGEGDCTRSGVNYDRFWADSVTLLDCFAACAAESDCVAVMHRDFPAPSRCLLMVNDGMTPASFPYTGSYTNYSASGIPDGVDLNSGWTCFAE